MKYAQYAHYVEYAKYGYVEYVEYARMWRQKINMRNMQNMQINMHTHTTRIHVPCFYMTLKTNMTEYTKKHAEYAHTPFLVQKKM